MERKADVQVTKATGRVKEAERGLAALKARHEDLVANLNNSLEQVMLQPYVFPFSQPVSQRV